MKKHLLSVAAAAACITAVFAAKPSSDPVLLNVAGKDVHLSEFQYLYNKNNNQQLEPITPAGYLDMFVDYKLKVADAEAAGIDTTAAFRNEYAQYRDELAKPYLRDQWVTDSLVLEAYGHYADDVTVSHIMLPSTPGSKERIDSIRREILAGHTSFAAAAVAFSVDAPSAAKGGRMGNVVPGRYPWAFEKAAYDTPVGSLSEPVNSGFGWHIIRVDARRPSQGEVHAAHILRMTRGMNPEQVAREREIIDSLHSVAASGTDFAELASKYSQDPGSARKGGDLGWFARGVMVQPFDSISFALPAGGLSEPFATDFGWHIIYKYGSRNARDLDQLRPQIEKAMERDDRGTAAERSYAARMIALHHGAEAAWQPAVTAVLATAEGPLDSLVASPSLASVAAFTIDGTTATLSSVAPRLAGVVTSPDVASTTMAAVEQAVKAALSDAALDCARAELMTSNPDYRNLMNEYRDGILLFEIANEKVWERATKDTDGLEAFFAEHRDRYTWRSPRFKSYVIFAHDDARLNDALEYAATLDASDPAAFSAAMTKRFGRNVKVERVIAAKGENPITDFLAFGGSKPEPKSKQWNSYAAFAGRIIDSPESAADVRQTVVADYQARLEAEWLKQLHERYPVKFNKKEIKKLHQ